MQDGYGGASERRGIERPVSRIDLLVANQGGRIGRWFLVIGILAIVCYIAYRIGSG